MPTLKESEQALWGTAETEQELQAGLRGIINRARQFRRIAQDARKLGHEKAEELKRAGGIFDLYREHALVDFLTGLVEEEASEIEHKVHRTLFVRKALI